MSKILRLHSENVKKIKVVDITPKDNLVVIGGNNGQGKSSVLDSIIYALTGKENIPEKPIRDTANNAEILVETEEYIIKRIFNRTETGYRTTLQLVSKNQGIISSGQGTLDKIVPEILDLSSFIKDKELRYKILIKLANIDLKEIKAKISDIEEQRKYIGRRKRELEALLRQKPEPEYNLPDKPIDTKELTIKLNNLKAEESSYNKIKNDIEVNKKRILFIENQIEQLLKEKESLIKSNNHLQELIKPSVSLEIEQITNEIKETKLINDKIAYRNEYSALENEIGNLSVQYDEFTKQRDEINESVKKHLEIIPGISIVDEEIYYANLPFEQLSQAEQIKLSLYMMLKLNPEFRVAIVKEGSLIDENNLKLLADISKEKNIQIWIEKVGNNGSEYIIEEGELK